MMKTLWFILLAVSLSVMFVSPLGGLYCSLTGRGHDYRVIVWRDSVSFLTLRDPSLGHDWRTGAGVPEVFGLYFPAQTSAWRYRSNQTTAIATLSMRPVVWLLALTWAPVFCWRDFRRQ
jgi:hypothetical protein